MFYPNNLEALAEERMQEMERQLQRHLLLASVRPPRQSWRRRAARLLRRLGEQLVRWGDRLALGTQTACPVPAPVEVD
jgi:hypothetical protein